MSNLVPSPPPDASGTLRGLVNVIAQTFAGVKTFTSAIIASAGVQVGSLWNTNGAGASDVCVKLGTSTADASVNSGAKLLKISTGIDGTEVEKAYVRKDGGAVFGNIYVGPYVYNGIPMGGVINQGTAIGFGNPGSGVYLGWQPGNGLSYALASFQSTSTLYLGNGTLISNTSGGAAQTLSLQSGLGALSTDVAVKAGPNIADASVHAGAKIFSIRTGLGGTEVERYSFTKDTVNWGGGGVWSQQFGSEIFWKTSGTPTFALLPTGVARSGYGIDINPAFGANLTLQLRSDGRIDQSGTDSSGTPGAATINKPIGKSAIANGATSVRITNSLVAVGDQVHATMQGDCGQRHWCEAGAGFFDLKLPAAAAANTAFCWTVSKRI